MSSRYDDRPYKVVYTGRRRDNYDEKPSRRLRREEDFDDDRHTYARDYRDEGIETFRRARDVDFRDERIESDIRSRASDTRSVTSGTTRTRYQVGRDRDAESYVKRSDAVVVDAPRYSGRSAYEVIRPDRRDDGTYIVDLGGADRGYSRDILVDVDPRRFERPARYDDYPPRFEARGGRVQPVRDVSYKNFHESEEIGDDKYSHRGRETSVYDEEPPPPRLKSALRGGNASPQRLRRQRSVGFYRDEINYHDASESKHERPGAEAHLAGRYLASNGSTDDDGYAPAYRPQNRSRSRSRGRYGPQRSNPRVHEYDDDEIDRRALTEETLRRYDYEDARPVYPPQRGQSRRRHRPHKQRGDDRYSEYDDEVIKKKTTTEYY